MLSSISWELMMNIKLKGLNGHCAEHYESRRFLRKSRPVFRFIMNNIHHLVRFSSSLQFSFLNKFSTTRGIDAINQKQFFQILRIMVEMTNKSIRTNRIGNAMNISMWFLQILLTCVNILIFPVKQQ